MNVLHCNRLVEACCTVCEKEGRDIHNSDFRKGIEFPEWCTLETKKVSNMNSCEKVIEANRILKDDNNLDNWLSITGNVWICCSTIYTECENCRYKYTFLGGIAKNCLRDKPCSQLWSRVIDTPSGWKHGQLIATKEFRDLIEALDKLR